MDDSTIYPLPSDILKSINWDSIPMDNPFIPYRDLGMSDTFGRRVRIPDDIMPSLALIEALSPTRPHALTCDENGALNVNLTASEATVNTTGGSSAGGITPVKMLSAQRDGYSTGNVGGPVDLGGGIPGPLKVLYGFSCSWCYDYTPGNAIPFGNLRFYISDESETVIHQLCRFGVSRNNFTADNGPPWLTGEEQTIMYPIPVDGSTWPDENNLFIRANGDLHNVFVNATIWYSQT